MKIFSLIFVMLLSTSASAVERYIDKAQESYDMKRAEYFKTARSSCSHLKTVGERRTCERKITDKADEKYPPRGSSAYSKKNYSGMSKEQAVAKLIELKGIYEKAHGGSKAYPGELTKNAVEAEASWIQENIFGRRTLSSSLSFYLPCEKQLAGSPIRKYCEIGGDKVLEGSIYSTE